MYQHKVLKEKDEELLSIQNKILAKAMMISFWIIIVGEFLFIFVVPGYIEWVELYFVVWGIPFYLNICGPHEGIWEDG